MIGVFASCNTNYYEVFMSLVSYHNKCFNLQNFSVTPEFKCVRIDLKNENHKWYSVAKFSSNRLATALSEFRSCIDRIS